MKWDEGAFYPPFFHLADRESDRCQATFLRWRGAEFVSLGFAAVAALVPRDVAWGVGPWLALAFFALPVGIRLSQVESKAERRWYDARSAAESMKSATWQYAVGGESYRIKDPNARSRFLALSSDICAELPSWQTGTTGDGSLVTESMALLRESDLDNRASTYIENRVINQVNWYGRKARFNRSRACRWGAFVLVVEAFALSLGIANVVRPLGLDYLGALAAIAAGLAGWKQTKRFNELAEVYEVTRNGTLHVRESIDATSEDVWARSVSSSEAAFSREHSMWLARRQGPLL